MKSLYLLIAALLISACSTQPAHLSEAPAKLELRTQLEHADRALREARLVDAEVLYRKLTEAHPRLPDVWLRLGNIYTRQAQLEAAARAYRDGLKHSPEDGRLWHNLALVELKQAIRTLETASQVIPADSPWRAHIEHLHGNLLSGGAQQARAGTAER